MHEFKIIGHRGVCAHEPENTLRSILRAIADGADMVEIDVRFAAGELLVIHDATVDRTTDGHGPIHHMTFEQIRNLDAGKGERIPTLSEILEVTLGTIPLNIEIKEVSATAPLCDLLLDFRGLEHQDLLLSSFHPEAMIEARGRLPEIRLGVLASDEPQDPDEMFMIAHELGAVSVHPHLRNVTRDLVQEAHRKCLLVLPYTVREPDELQHLIDCQADGCFADDPRWAAAILGRPDLRTRSR